MGWEALEFGLLLAIAPAVANLDIIGGTCPALIVTLHVMVGRVMANRTASALDRTHVESRLSHRREVDDVRRRQKCVVRHRGRSDHAVAKRAASSPGCVE